MARRPSQNIVDAGAAADFSTLLIAIVRDDRSKVRALLKRQPGLAAFGVDEARLYQSKIVHWLYVNDTALHLAAAGHRAEIARMLLAAGADVRAARNHRESCPLHYAADGFIDFPSYNAARQVKMIRCLLEAGADLRAADKNGATALHRAVRTRCAAAVECLLDAGADPTAGNHGGATPFHLAVQNTGRGGSGSPAAKVAQARIIDLMLARGVSPAIRDERGRSVLEWATSEGVRQQLLSGSGRER